MLAVQSDGVLPRQWYFGNNRYTAPAGTSCRACMKLLAWSLCIHIPSQVLYFRREACKQSVRVPTEQTPVAQRWKKSVCLHPRDRLPWPRFLRSSSKMLEIPPVPFVACSHKCACAAGLPWPWESLGIEFKRLVNARYPKERERGEKHSTVI